MGEWPRTWRARWIWLEQRKEVTDCFAYLRRSFELSGTGWTGRCRITADGRYVLWVNGSLVGRGPIRSEPEHLTYDSYDLTSLLVPGRNVVAVLARHYGRPTVHWKPAPAYGDLGRGGVCVEAVFDTGDVGTLIASDRSWRAMAAPYEAVEHPPYEGPPDAETLDGRGIPFGWDTPGFDDSSWDHAIELAPHGLGVVSASPPSEPFGALPERPIPHLAERIVRPRSVADDTYDFGEIVFAHPIVAVEADEGTTVELTCGEDLDGEVMPVIAERSWVMRYTAAGRPNESFESFEPVGFRYVRVTAEARRLELSARERTYPRPDGASFSCSDPVLNRIWTAGARTLDVCSADSYIDCPGREQRAWLGDAFLASLISFVCNPDTGLARWNVRLHAQGARSDGLFPMVAAGDFSMRPETIPDFSLAWIWELARVWEYTGDRRAVEDLLPAGLRALQWFEDHVGDDGLLADLTGWVFIDWAQLERRRNFAAVDAMYVMALDDAAMLSMAMDDHGTAERLRARAARTRLAFERYWDSERGAYVDAADPGGQAGRRISQQTNAVAILSGCAPRERWDRMLSHVLDQTRLVRTATPGDPGTLGERLGRQWEAPKNFDDEHDVVLAQPFFCHFLHRALVLAGRHDLLLPSIRRWKPLLDRGNGCFEEYWDAAPGFGSRAHAWSATPVFDLSTYVLGVRPASPGFATAVIEPYLGDLEHTSGAVPTPLGFIRVEAGAERIAVELPIGMTATVRFDGEEYHAGPGQSEWKRRVTAGT